MVVLGWDQTQIAASENEDTRKSNIKKEKNKPTTFCKVKHQDSLNIPFKTRNLEKQFNYCSPANLSFEWGKILWQELTSTTLSKLFILWLTLGTAVPSNKLPAAERPMTWVHMVKSLASLHNYLPETSLNSKQKTNHIKLLLSFLP